MTHTRMKYSHGVNVCKRSLPQDLENEIAASGLLPDEVLSSMINGHILMSTVVCFTPNR